MSAILEARVATLERQIDTLLRRQGSPFAFARSTMSVNDTGAVQTVQAQLDALSIRDNIPLLYGYGVTGSPPVSADLHIAFLDGDRSKAVIVASGHQTYRLKGLAVGDSALYDSRGHQVWLTPAGITLTGNVAHAGNYTLTGNLSVIGNVSATGSVIAGSGGADQVGLQTHKHPAANTPPTPNT
jgi:phage gp45-like